MREIRIIPVEGIGEVAPGDDVAALVVAAAGALLRRHDVVVVTQKIVSKAEGRIAPRARRAETIRAESARVLRRAGDMLISQTHHGFVCANAGVDESNVPDGVVSLLPPDPDASARRIRERIRHLAGVDVAVVVSDTFGRAWRVGQTDVAIGLAGIEPLLDYRDTRDTHGRTLTATRIAVADEIAGAAEMVMGKAAGIPVAIVRGAPASFGRGSATELVRPTAQDLFR